MTPTSCRARRAGALAMMMAIGSLLSAGCAARARPALLADAQTAMRVKTVLLNDPVVGLEDLRVDVDEGIAYLSGQISAEARRGRILELVRATPGVKDVQLVVEIRPEVAALARRLHIPQPDGRAGRRHLLGLGASIRLTGSPAGQLDDAINVTPLFSLGSGEGWGPAIGLGWSSRSLLEGIGGRPPLAKLTLRPVMAGVSFTKPVGHVNASFSLVGGYAFNGLDLDDEQPGSLRAIAVSNTLVWRPAVSLKVDATDRVGLQLSAGYLVARPRVTFASDTALRTERINADALMVSIGAIYWIF